MITSQSRGTLAYRSNKLDISYFYSQMSSPPFQNSYRLREVAQSDSKSCFVCHKPTCKVLISENKADFFYTCVAHLKDPTFATPIENEPYKELIKQKSQKVIKIAELETEIKNLGYSWDIISKIPNPFGKKAEKQPEPTDATPKPKTLSKDGPELQKQLSQMKSETEELSKSIETFVFKEYNLDDNIYRNRVRGYIQAKYNQKRQQELHNPGFFPSAPSGALQGNKASDS